MRYRRTAPPPKQTVTRRERRCPEGAAPVNAETVPKPVYSPVMKVWCASFLRSLSPCSITGSQCGPIAVRLRDSLDWHDALCSPCACFGPFRLRIYPQNPWVSRARKAAASQAQRPAIFLKKARKRCLTGQGHLPINRLHEVTAACSFGGNVHPLVAECLRACPEMLFVA